jgi:hypothetical protein
MREAYDSTYDYRNKGAEPSKAQPASGSLTPEEQAELEQLRARFPRR